MDAKELPAVDPCWKRRGVGQVGHTQYLRNRMNLRVSCVLVACLLSSLLGIPATPAWAQQAPLMLPPGNSPAPLTPIPNPQYQGNGAPGVVPLPPAQPPTGYYRTAQREAPGGQSAQGVEIPQPATGQPLVGSRYFPTPDGPNAAPPASGTNPASAQVPSGTENKVPSKPVPTVADVQDAIKAVDASTELDDTAKAALKEMYQQTLKELNAAATSRELSGKYQQSAALAAEAIVNAKEELDEPAEAARLVPPQNSELSQLQELLAERQQQLTATQQQLTDLEKEVKRRGVRKVDLPQAINEAKARVAEIEQKLKTAPPPGESPMMQAAREGLQAARYAAATQELETLQRELASYEAESELLPLRRDLIVRQSNPLESDVRDLTKLVNQRRTIEAQQQAKQAQEVADQAWHPELRPVAETNAKLAQRRTELATDLANLTSQLQKSNKEFDELDQQFERTKARVETVGLTTSIGLLLRKQRANLLDIAQLREQIAQRQPKIRTAQAELFDLDEQRSELADIDALLQTTLTSEADPEVQQRLRDLLVSQRDYLDALINDSGRYFDLLVEVNTSQQQIVELAQQYAEYVDERVLWIRSTYLLSWQDFRYAVEALTWIADPRQWTNLGRTLAADITDNPTIALLGLCIFAILIRYQRRMRAKLSELGRDAQRRNAQQFRPTAEALILTLVISTLWPGLLWFIGWRLQTVISSSDFVRALAYGLKTVAATYLPLELMRQTCRRRGLAEAHFGWSEAVLGVWRRNLRWVMVLALPMVLISGAMHGQSNERWQDSLGRFAFVGAALLFSVFVQRLARPEKGVLSGMLSQYRDGWLDRLRYAWYSLFVAGPVALAILAAAGYFFTAEELARRLVTTAQFALFIMLIGASLVRWLLISRRRLAIQQARERQAQMQQVREESNVATAPPETVTDLAALNAQTLQLIRSFLVVAVVVGFAYIWRDVLPAFGVFDKVTLWYSGTGEERVAVSLWHVLLLIPIMICSVIAARNVPGLLEIVLLEHLPLESAVRYAITTLSRYAITIVGLLLMCGMIGITWSTAQWLVAALSVGLGFGLQEIFANFVSGIIILFERPIRVGDIITLDDVSGVVSRIHIRSTTITDWDRKELIVPNKDLITGRLLNWTLSDRTNRIVINVGVAYGSDTEKATQILKQILSDHPQVLKDPAPVVTFEGFGDSTLDFVVRAYLSSLEFRLQTIHELHSTIHRVFGEEDLEIAFPQRDVHIKLDNAMAMVEQLRHATTNTKKMDNQNAA